MEQQSNNLRERLLAALPQPENLAAYREETAALLSKHARALRWDRITARTFIVLAILLFECSAYFARLGPVVVHGFQIGAALMFFMGAIYLVQHNVYDSQIATLKEIKQVQLQILELQALLRKEQ